jgi:hypothetical protein
MPESEAPERQDLLFRYYQQQWEQVRHCESQRSSLTLQLLVLAGAAVAAYVNVAASEAIRLALGLLVVIVGVAGYLAVVALEQAANIHIERARKARQQIPVIEQIASGTRGFYPLARYYLWLDGCVAIFGVLLALYAVWR